MTINNNNICKNCGELGHIYKYCNKPVMSFGLICYRKNFYINEYEYLMIQRRNSLSFVEFIRGKYELHDSYYIKSLMSLMTVYERKLLTLFSFDELWNKVWYNPSIRKHISSDYSIAKRKFEQLVNTNTLEVLLSETYSKYYEPEWGFPKGRRKLREKDIDCAIREFCEETGLSKSEIKLAGNREEFEENFYGTNKVAYRHVYYIAKIVKNVYKNILINYFNIHQVREVKQVKWFSANEVLKRIRDYNPERRQLFIEAVGKIVKYNSIY